MPVGKMLQQVAEAVYFQLFADDFGPLRTNTFQVLDGII